MVEQSVLRDNDSGHGHFPCELVTTRHIDEGVLINYRPVSRLRTRRRDSTSNTRTTVDVLNVKAEVAQPP